MMKKWGGHATQEGGGRVRCLGRLLGRGGSCWGPCKVYIVMVVVLGRGGICVYSLAWEQKGGMNMGRWKGTQP